MAADVKLLPCPLCGNPDVSIETSDTGYAVICFMRNGCKSRTGTWPTEADAIAAWNCRSPELHSHRARAGFAEGIREAENMHERAWALESERGNLDKAEWHRQCAAQLRALAPAGQPVEPARAELVRSLRLNYPQRNMDGTPTDVAIAAAIIDTGYFAAPPAKGETAQVSEAARDVLAERRRQIEVGGWTAEHDDQHDTGEIARAAACYASFAGLRDRQRGLELYSPGSVFTAWPWRGVCWKPSDRRRDLVKAGALILAEIERLDRATARTCQKGGK